MESKYTIIEQRTEQEYWEIGRRLVGIIHEAEKLWFDQPELGQWQVAETVVSTLALRDLITLASAHIAHFMRSAEDIS